MTVSYLPTRSQPTHHSSIEIGVDLSALGAAERDIAPDLPAAPADLLRLAAVARGVARGGLSFSALGPQFRLQPPAAGRRARETTGVGSDSLQAARRISAAGTAAVVPSVPAQASPAEVIGELARFSRQHGGPSRLHIEVGTDLTAARNLVRAIRQARADRAPEIVVSVASADDVALAGEIADLVRIRETDLAWARELRYAVRAAAGAAGRDPIPVLVDVRTVIGQDPITARVRAELVETLQHAPSTGVLTIIDTADKASRTLGDWLGGGAADGFVVEPGSLTTDLTAIIHQVIPGLQELGYSLAGAPTAPRRSLQTAAG